MILRTHPSSIISRIIFSLTLIISSQAIVKAQGWKADPFDHRVFIENKGQFDQSTDDATVPVYFGTHVQGTETYFTANGVCYSQYEVVLLNKREKDSMIAVVPSMANAEKESEEKENERYHFSKTVPRFLKVEWVGANMNAHVETEGLVSNYFTYPKDKSVHSATLIAQAYQKITYKNIYPNIDIEYIIPKDKDGIKYSLILHPGADLSVVKMKYKYAKKLELDIDGNVVVKSSFGEFVDHAPISFYEEGGIKVNSSFDLNGNVVTFKSDNYDKNKTVIVDPWTTNPAFLTWNRAYDVVYDKNGNVWAYGGNYPWQLEKFDINGNILWTYNSTGMYNAGCCSGSCYGDVAVDETSGSCYLSEGFDPSTGSRVFKVNTAGIQTIASTGNVNLNEIWRMEYNRCTNVIIGTGGGTSCCYNGIVIDTTFTTMNPVVTYSQSHTDNWGMTIDPTTNWLYMATVQGSPGPNPMIKVPVPALTPQSWIVASGYNFGEISSVMYATNACCANGFNGMSASLNWLYTYDGTTLIKWDKGTGAQIASLPTGGTMYASGGTSTDVCDNVFVGVGNMIKQYSSSLTLLSSIPTGGTTYDVKLGPNNGKIYASGDGFVQQLTVPINSSSISLTSSPNSNCSNCNGTATANITICGQPSVGVGYTWMPSGQTTQTATGLCAGLYTITISTQCGVSTSDTITVHGTGNGGFTITTTTTGGNCTTGNYTGTATPNGGQGPFTYSWTTSPVQTTQSATGLNSGTYTVFITDANGCTGQAIITIGTGVGVTATATNVQCSTSTNGAASATPVGGVGPYTYSWTPGNQTGQNISNLSPGTYTVYITDANGCTSSTSVSITAPNPLSINLNLTNVPCFGGNNGSATATPVGGTAPFNYVWNTSPPQTTQTATGLTSGTYIVTITDANGCTQTSTAIITQPTSTDTLTITASFCEGDSVGILTAPNVNGPFQWYYDNTIIPNATSNILVIIPSNVNHYTVTWNLNGCTRTTIIKVITPPAPYFLPDTTANVFTPNGDGRNDIFYPYQSKLYTSSDIDYYAKDFSINIYNRWGKLVYQSNDYKPQWDGKIDGKEGSPGVYYWVSSYISRCGPDNSPVINKGFVHLLR